MRRLTMPAAIIALAACASTAMASPPTPDLGKRACAKEARRLCPAEMKSFNRKRVEACMIAKIQLTSPTCHAAMLTIKAQREAAAKR